MFQRGPGPVSRKRGESQRGSGGFAARFQPSPEQSACLARAVAVCVAARPARPQAHGAVLAGADRHRQAGDGDGALYAQVGNRCAGAVNGRQGASHRRDVVAGRRAGFGGHRLRSVAHFDDAAGASARRHVRQGRDARRAQAGALDVRTYAPFVAAVSSGEENRRADAHSGARPRWHRKHLAHGADDADPDDRRVCADHRRVRAWNSTGATS